MQRITPNGRIGTPHWRIEGVAKVTGQALFGADQQPSLGEQGRARELASEQLFAPANIATLAYSALVTSPIARGRIRSIEDAEARRIAGVLQIFTHENVGAQVKPGKPFIDKGYMAQAVAPLHSDRIFFPDQVIAVVVANSAEIAQAAASAMRFHFDAEAPAPFFDSPEAKVVKAKSLGEPEIKSGDVEKGLAASATVVDAWYETPPQHHNPMELFQTTCAWHVDHAGLPHLTVWESTQNVRGFQYGLAEQLGILPAQVRVLSPFIGGAFGSKGELGQFTALIAFAARELGRPVKFVATRRQCFSLRTFRAETRHHLRLGADAKGSLLAIDHESWELTSRTERFATAGSDSTARLYACRNVRTLVHNVETDRQAPGFMRAPPEMPYLFAMESAMDELSYGLGIDPVELRRRNDTMVELATSRPYTSRSLLRCIDHGAALFGWDERNPAVGSMSNDDELIGWGFASAFYPTQIGPADCRITLMPPERANNSPVCAIVEVGTHEIGTGVRTVAALTVADLLGLPLEAIEMRIGDSQLPPAPLSAGSNSTATICNVLAKCCEEIRSRLARRAVRDRRSALYACDPRLVRLLGGHAVFTHDPAAIASSQPQSSAEHPHQHRAHTDVSSTLADRPSEPLALTLARVSRGMPLVQKTTHVPHGAPPLRGPAMVRRGKAVMVGGANLKDRMQFAHGAHFVEVRISRGTGMIRATRVVGVFAGGRIMNPRTAYAQLQGGQIWGLSSALLEATEIDPLVGRYTNANLAEYHIPVCRDVGELTSVLLDEEDSVVNPLGIKGIGELGTTGMAAAVTNAVYHATGVRVRKLPVRAEHVLQSLGASM